MPSLDCRTRNSSNKRFRTRLHTYYQGAASEQGLCGEIHRHIGLFREGGQRGGDAGIVQWSPGALLSQLHLQLHVLRRVRAHHPNSFRYPNPNANWKMPCNSRRRHGEQPSSPSQWGGEGLLYRLCGRSIQNTDPNPSPAHSRYEAKLDQLKSARRDYNGCGRDPSQDAVLCGQDTAAGSRGKPS